MTGSRIEEGLEALIRAAQASKALSGTVAGVATRYVAVLRGGGTLYFCGNGGSAADAQHLAAEYVVRYALNRRPLAAVALTTDTSILTAAGNDLGFEQIFARQVEALCTRRDLLILHSTSGQSPNLLAAARTARKGGVPTVAFLGKGGGALAGLVDETVIVPANETSLVQLIHLALQHLIVEAVEAELLES
ncbi:MAG TPA: SIS domain-containing protein [Gemmatimonadales bacterium]|nr:SIS domain-containing protein [Gemmatimonadales bacterium]